MARISVEQKALTDSRFAHLGLALGAETAPAAFGIGIMTYIWNECQEQSAYRLSNTALDALGRQLGIQNLQRAVVASSLGELDGRGWTRIKGTRGRIEWLEEKRKSNNERQKRHREQHDVSRVTNALVTRLSRGAPAPAPAPAEETNPPIAPLSGGGADWRRKAPGTRTARSPLADPERRAWLEEQFGKLYEFYPRHVGKDAAWRAFLKADPDAATLRWIGRDIKRRTDAGEWQPLDEERSRFIPHLATYLNQRRWTDTEETA